MTPWAGSNQAQVLRSMNRVMYIMDQLLRTPRTGFPLEPNLRRREPAYYGMRDSGISLHIPVVRGLYNGHLFLDPWQAAMSFCQNLLFQQTAPPGPNKHFLTPFEMTLWQWVEFWKTVNTQKWLLCVQMKASWLEVYKTFKKQNESPLSWSQGILDSPVSGTPEILDSQASRTPRIRNSPV